MVVAVGELDLQLDPGEERRGRVEDEPVRAGGELVGEPGAAVGVRLGRATVPSGPASSTVTPAAGSPAPVSSTCVESEQLIAANLRAWTRWARAISASSARTSAPPRTTSSPPTTSRSTRCGPEKTRPATDRRRRRARARRSPRSRGRPASPARASRCRRGGAPPRRRACRAGAPRARSSPPPPPRPRATSSACLTSRNRSLRSFEAEPSTPSPTRAPASSSARTGATPAPRRRFDVGQCATPVPVSAKRATSPSERWTQWAHHTSSAEPPEALEVLDRRAPVELAAVRLLLDGLGEVRVEHEAEPPRERRRLLHQPSGDRERRARRDGDLHARSGPALVEGAVEPLGLGEHRVELLDELVGRQAAVRDAEVHRAARRDEAHAELARRLDLGLEDAGPAAREDVVVVEDGRAAGERQLGEPRARGCVLRLRVDPGPDRIQLAEPREEVGLLGPRAREGLVEVVVRVDEARRDDGAAEVDRARRAAGSAPRRRPRRSSRPRRAPSRRRARCRRRPS